MQRIEFGWDNNFDNTSLNIRLYMQRFEHRRDNRTIVPLFRALFVVIAALASVCGYGATRGCVVPAFVVPIADLDATVDRCKNALRSDPARGIGTLRSLVAGWVCEGDYERSVRAGDALECLARRRGALPDESGPLLGKDDFDAAHCVVARQTLEWAARRGNGEAYFELYELGLGAHWSGERRAECAPDLATAAKDLEAAAALKIPRAEEELAVAMMAHIDETAYRALDDPFAQGRLLMAQTLGEASRHATRAQALALLESAARDGYPSTLGILSTALAAGFWGPADDEALAWAAIDAARYEADPGHDLFPRLFALANAASRAHACVRIREITRDDISFRYRPDEIVNPLMLQCVDEAAIVHDAKCLDDAAIAGIEGAIEPLVAQTPECAEWTIATAGYSLEPPGAASIESLAALPGVVFDD